MRIKGGTESGEHSFRMRECTHAPGKNVDGRFDGAMLEQFASPGKVVLFAGFEFYPALILALGSQRIVERFFNVSEQTMPVGTIAFCDLLLNECLCLFVLPSALISLSQVVGTRKIIRLELVSSLKRRNRIGIVTFAEAKLSQGVVGLEIRRVLQDGGPQTALPLRIMYR